MTKNNLGRKPLFQFTTFHHQGRQGRNFNREKNLEVETEAKAREKSCLLANSLRLAQLALIQPRNKCPKGHLHQLSIKKVFHRHAWRQILWGHILSWGSFSKNDYNLCQVDVKLPAQLERLMRFETQLFPHLEVKLYCCGVED